MPPKGALDRLTCRATASKFSKSVASTMEICTHPPSSVAHKFAYSMALYEQRSLRQQLSPNDKTVQS